MRNNTLKRINEARHSLGERLHSKLHAGENLAHVGIYSALGMGQHELYAQLGLVLVLVLVVNLIFNGFGS